MTFESFFKERIQFDSNSCGIWFVAGFCSLLKGLPDIQEKCEAFDLCYNLLSIPTEEQLKIVSSAEFLINALTKSPETSEYFRKVPQKGIRTNFFYICDLSEVNLADISADDNGSYIKTRKTKRTYSYLNGQINTAHEDFPGSDTYYFNERRSFNKYTRVPVPIENAVALERTYCKCKSFPRTRSIITLSNPINFSISPYVAVIYQIQSPKNESNKVLHHGNATKNVDKPYIKTSKKVLEKTKKLLPEGWSSKTVYDKVNRDSAGTMYSTSQSNELRDTRQVYRQAAKLNENKESNPNESHDELESIVSYQKIHPEFIRSVTLLKRSYYIFFGDNIQLNDVAKFCCEMDDVLCIDTTFNLCSSWVTDTSYKNLRLLNHYGTFTIFLGPCIVHFEKYDFIFNRFASEMCSYQLMIRSLKTIGTDLEKAIYNGFSS